MDTGEVELHVDDLEIVSRSTPLPFQLDEENVDELLRLRYRWLDLRTERMQRNLRLSGSRRLGDSPAHGGARVRRPLHAKPDARDARRRPGLPRPRPAPAGSFFALPQSPQIFKQLFMIAGFDRYYQIALCFRDEDLRADRQFEFRQLDVEMAFAEREDVLGVLEEAVRGSFEALGREPPPSPFPRLTWQKAWIASAPTSPTCASGWRSRTRRSDARLRVRRLRERADRALLVVPKVFSRAELARLEELAKERGAKGLAYLVFDGAGEVRSPIAKFLSEA